ncbi:MAG: glycosyltransferase family 39 protein [Candidatus Eisenbacteria bacterium]
MSTTSAPGGTPMGRGWLLLFAVLLFAVLLVATALRSYDLTGKCLWVDEANSVSIAAEPVGERLATLRLDSSPPLFYFALNGWMDVFGSNEAAVRSLSVAGGILLVAVVFWVGTSLFGTWVGAFAASFLAISPVQIFYSQQCRMYSWLTALSILGGYLLWRAVRDGRREFIVGWAATTLAALYLHNVAFYLLPGHAVVLLWQRFWKRNLGWWIGSFLAVVILYLPWAPHLLEQVRNETHYAWFQEHWQRMGPWGAIRRTLVAFSPTFPELPFQFAESVRANTAAVVSAGILALVGAVMGTRHATGTKRASETKPATETRQATETKHATGTKPATGARPTSETKPNSATTRENTVWVVLMLVLPLGFGILSSMLLRPSYVPGRSDQVALPAFALLVAIGVSALRPVWLRWICLAGILGFAGSSLPDYYGNESDRTERELAAAIDQNARPGDVVICTSLTRASIEYYLERARPNPPDDSRGHALPRGHALTILSFPRDTADHLGNQNDQELLSDPAQLAAEADSVWSEVRSHVRGRDDVRVFVLVDMSPVNQSFHEGLRAGRERIGYRELRQLGVFRQSGTGHRIGVDVAVFRGSPS